MNIKRWLILITAMVFRLMEICETYSLVRLTSMLQTFLFMSEWVIVIPYTKVFDKLGHKNLKACKTWQAEGNMIAIKCFRISLKYCMTILKGIATWNAIQNQNFILIIFCKVVTRINILLPYYILHNK